MIGGLARRFSKVLISIICEYGVPSIWSLYVFVFILVFYALPDDIYIGGQNSHSHNVLDRLIYPLFIGIIIPIMHEVSKNLKLDFWIGQLSYPFYLVHGLIIDIYSSLAPVSSFGFVIVFFISLFVSGLLVLGERNYIEPWRSKFAH